MKICVIGAGIIGTTSTYLIQKRFPNCEIVIYADKFTPNNTSDGAAGIWFPGPVGDTPPEKIEKWSRFTLNYVLNETKNNPDVGKSGISKVHGYVLSKAPGISPPSNHQIAPDFKILNEDELKNFPSFVQSAYSFTTMVIESKKLIPALMKQIIQNGGRYIQRKITDLSNLQDYDVIINCSGLGSKHLFKDEEVFPIRGQIIRMRAPWIKQFYHSGPGLSPFVIPNQDTVVVGSVNQRHCDSTEIRKKERDSILQRAYQLVPSLQQAEIVEDWVGIRPGRSSIRLAKQTLEMRVTGGLVKKIVVIHNYGHGGNGIALSFGCAEEVVSLITSEMKEKAKL